MISLLVIAGWRQGRQSHAMMPFEWSRRQDVFNADALSNPVVKLRVPKITTQTLAGLSREAMIGQVGMVVHYSEQEGRGKLKFPAPVVGNDEWEFIHDQPLKNGDKVQVVEISGNSLFVKFQG